MADSVLHTHTDDPSERLSALLDNTLTGAEQETAQRLVDDCAACRTELGELRMMQGWLRDLPVVVPPRSFTLDPAQYQRTPGNRWFGLIRWGSVLAILLLFAGIGITALRSGGGRATTALQVPNSAAATGGQGAAGSAAENPATGPASGAAPAATAAAAAGAQLKASEPTTSSAGVADSAATVVAPLAAAAAAQPAPPAPESQSGSVPTEGVRSMALAATPTGELLPTPPPLTAPGATAVPPAVAPAVSPRASRFGTLWLALMVVLVLAAVLVVIRRRS